MGRFFSSVQIKNNVSREQFIKAFGDVMKKRSLVTCSEAEASIGYILAFSANDGWVTLTSEVHRDNPKQLKDDARQIAADLKTSSFSMEVADSDWAYIELYTGADIHDTVVVGRSELDEEHSPKGREECWKQLLASGKSWEQLSEIWNKNEVFVEDALYEAAAMLGIEPKYMVSDCEDFNSTTDEDTNVAQLFFKNKITVSKGGEKKLTLNAAFKQVFGEALEPLGFVKIKSKYPYYVRVLNGEVVQVVAVKEEFENTFDIVSGIATVYRNEIDLSKSVRWNTNWFMTLANYYSICLKSSDTDYDKNYARKMIFLNFNFSTNEQKIKIFEYALEQFKKWVLPIFNKVTSVKVAYYYYSNYLLRSPIGLQWLQYENISPDDESLDLFIFDDPYEVREQIFKHILETIDYEQKHNLENHPQEYFTAGRRNSETFEKEQREIMNKIFSSEDNYQKVLNELDRRKNDNIERLRSYGAML